MPRDLDWHWGGGTFHLEFFLGAGAFATALLRELVCATAPLSADDELA